MNKKGLLYNLTLTIVVISLLSYALFKFYVKYNQFEPIGKKQLNLFVTYQKAESSLFYIDQSAKYSLQQAVYELAKVGGISDVEKSEVLTPKEAVSLPQTIFKKCGRFYGYSLWYEDSNYCFDEGKLKQSIELLFNKKLNDYLSSHPSNIPLDNYIYDIRNKLEIIGRAKDPLIFDIAKDEIKDIVKEPKEEKFITDEGILDTNDFTGTELCAKGSKCVLAKEAYNLLQEAEKIAKERLKQKGVKAACLDENKACLEVTSGYRSKEEQFALWEGRTPQRYAQRFPIEEERKKYVCNPNLGVEECPHMTGKSIDIRFKESKMAIEDWRELEKILYKAGFRRYVAELWHFECCGTARYKRAVELKQKTGKEVTAVA